MSKKCIVWGIGNDYMYMRNQFLYEIEKGNIEIVALVARCEDIVERSLDGVEVITKDDISSIEFDYLIITSSKYYKEIYLEALKIGVDAKRIINGVVLRIPLFDFKRYFELIENNITILSDNCWGGNVYHYFNMQFYSPLVNILWQQDEYSKFIQAPEYYLKQPLVMEREGDLRGNIYPRASLGKGNKKVYMELIHEVSFSEAQEAWNRRKERINYNNIFVEMGFDATEQNKKEYLDIFDKIPYKKICFYSENCQMDSVVYLKRFEKYVKSHEFIYMSYIKYCLNIRRLSESLDILKLLNGEPDYIREK
jgi:uncharacterized protein (DUF1919 family)